MRIIFMIMSLEMANTVYANIKIAQRIEFFCACLSHSRPMITL